MESDHINQVCSYATIICIGLIYAVTQWLAEIKGDKEDRDKLRTAKSELKKQTDQTARESNVIELAYNMINEGKDLRQVEALLKRYKMEISVDEILSIIDRDSQINNVPHSQSRSSTSSNHSFETGIHINQQNESKPQVSDSDNTSRPNNTKNRLDEKSRRTRNTSRERASLAELRKGLKLAYSGEEKSVGFGAVAGIDDAQYELEELVTFFRDPEKFRKSGARRPRGLLLCGPPGTGKTLLARAAAGESGVSFLSVNASEFVEMFVGVGAARIRDLFSHAREIAPAIIFIDELDAIGRQRASGGSSDSDERDQTLNQLLSLMDGFDDDSDVIVIGATNRKDILDSALVRPGRFDRVISVNLPNRNGRVAILETYLRAYPKDSNLELRNIANECQGFSGAQLSSIVNLAAINTARRSGEYIENKDIFAALEFERLGPVRSNPLPNNSEKRVALLESATSLAASLLPAIEDVWTVSIVPRENYSFGKTVLKFEQNRSEFFHFTRNYLEEQLVMELAGIAAEKILFDKDNVSSIAEERLSNARRIVTKLVVSASMSESKLNSSFRTASYALKGTSRTNLQIVPWYASSIQMTELDQVRQRKIVEGLRTTTRLLSRNLLALDELTKTLIAKKKMTGNEIRKIIEKHHCSSRK
jgi:cell division protease FtsH